jgi:hypothetical protein
VSERCSATGRPWRCFSLFPFFQFQLFCDRCETRASQQGLRQIIARGNKAAGLLSLQPSHRSRAGWNEKSERCRVCVLQKHNERRSNKCGPLREGSRCTTKERSREAVGGRGRLEGECGWFHMKPSSCSAVSVFFCTCCCLTRARSTRGTMAKLSDCSSDSGRTCVSRCTCSSV